MSDETRVILRDIIAYYAITLLICWGSLALMMWIAAP